MNLQQEHIDALDKAETLMFHSDFCPYLELKEMFPDASPLVSVSQAQGSLSRCVSLVWRARYPTLISRGRRQAIQTAGSQRQHFSQKQLWMDISRLPMR
jgi:hypothetical protein